MKIFNNYFFLVILFIIFIFSCDSNNNEDIIIPNDDVDNTGGLPDNLSFSPTTFTTNSLVTIKGDFSNVDLSMLTSANLRIDLSDKVAASDNNPFFNSPIVGSFESSSTDSLVFKITSSAFLSSSNFDDDSSISSYATNSGNLLLFTDIGGDTLDVAQITLGYRIAPDNQTVKIGENLVVLVESPGRVYYIDDEQIEAEFTSFIAPGLDNVFIKIPDTITPGIHTFTVFSNSGKPLAVQDAIGSATFTVTD